MSTRSTTHFVHVLDSTPTAIVYRHSDGYPSGAGADLQTFLADVAANVADTRFSDPAYLAAKYVVWLADRFANRYDSKTGAYVKTHRLDFLSVGICASDPSDIEYRYSIVCDGATPPAIFCDELSGSGPMPLAMALAG